MDDRKERATADARGAGSMADTLWQVANPVGIAFISISAFVFVFTFPMRLTHRMLIKSLVPVFGVEFAVVYIVVQLALLALLKSHRGLAMAAGAFLVGMGLGWIGMHGPLAYTDVDVPGFTAARHIIGGGAVVSGFVVGLALVKGWLYRPK